MSENHATGDGSSTESLKKLVKEVGLSDFQEDEYDIPTFLRKQAD